ncbi:hypothetical protein COCMIDRAFT_39398 [Bipolaris oryzae ATCC 44560]|uniref:Uncharacterized protein n=1 Tax=Bipolaris oryzae ATCC 44560 TaxID=930090 RepID=W6ZGD3_COCMI|nr:uncharacterized protein COCMIDRAFT_39398 [Bipolaris oryzae ATCC 44560]EUC42556.1 hypothetical protein COCMIDRAFT_39398 [Bipolaris oryzae ATCC 44560]
MEEGKSLESVAGQVLGGQSGMQDGSFPMPRARRKDLVLGRTTLPWSRRQLSEAGKGEMNESRAVNARTFVAQSAKSGAFKTGRANEGARAQSEKTRNHISRKKEQLQGAMRQGAGGGPALAQAHARRGARPSAHGDGEGDHDDQEDGGGGRGQRQVKRRPISARQMGEQRAPKDGQRHQRASAASLVHAQPAQVVAVAVVAPTLSPSNNGALSARRPSPLPGHYRNRNRNRCRQQTSLPSMATAQPCHIHSISMCNLHPSSASSTTNCPVHSGPCGWPSLGTLFRAACALLRSSPTPLLSAATLAQLEASLKLIRARRGTSQHAQSSQPPLYCGTKAFEKARGSDVLQVASRQPVCPIFFGLTKDGWLCCPLPLATSSPISLKTDAAICDYHGYYIPLTTAAIAAAAQRSALARCGSWRNSYRQPGGTWPDGAYTPCTTHLPASYGCGGKTRLSACFTMTKHSRENPGCYLARPVAAAAKPVAAVAIEAILSDDQPTLPGPVRRRYAKLRSASTSMIAAAAKAMSDRRLLSPQPEPCLTRPAPTQSFAP